MKENLFDNNSNVFKKCPNCASVWKTKDDFLIDPNVEIIGYQVNFVKLGAGVFLFNHNCRATFALTVGELEDLYDGPVFKERQTGGDQCPTYCLYKNELDPCPAQCECAWVRELIQIVKKWPKIYQSEMTSIHGERSKKN